MPPLVLTCHWMLGAGEPEAAAVKVAAWPAVIAWLLGLVVTTGGTRTVNMTAGDVAEPAALVKTSRYQ